MLSNCLLVAWRLWRQGGRHDWLAFRRSRFWRGFIPHAMHIREDGPELVMTEYVPPSEPGDKGADSQLLFDGYYRIRRYALVEESRVK